MTKKIRYGFIETIFPCRWNDTRAEAFINGKWVACPDVKVAAKQMRKHEFNAMLARAKRRARKAAS